MNNKTSFLIFGIFAALIVVFFVSGVLKNPFSQEEKGEGMKEETQELVNLQNKENNMEQKTNEIGTPHGYRRYIDTFARKRDSDNCKQFRVSC